MNENLKLLKKEQQDLARRLFVAREEQRACDMNRYWANCSAPINMDDIITELFWVIIEPPFMENYSTLECPF